MKYDFGGWATKNDITCTDGRIIRKDAFKVNNGRTVPLVWNHQHNEPENVLGHALLENRKEGVYAYCTFNDTEKGMISKEMVRHGDITQLSIFANRLKQQGANVIHGAIREVSLVLAGANEGALIDSIMIHGEESEEEGVIFSGEPLDLTHSDKDDEEDIEETEEKQELKHTEKEEKKEEPTVPEQEKTVKEVFDSMSEEQKTVVYAMLAQVAEDAKNGKLEDDEDEDENGGGTDMKHNVFDNEDQTNENFLSHADMENIISDAKRLGSMKASFLEHADGVTATYGIDNVDYLFPEARNLNTPPSFIQRDMGWVRKVMGGTHHTPFSRIKSMHADITEDDARAKGYIKGNLKKEEVFSLLKRTTTPTTIYKKQKMDRDDVIDITDFDVIAWLKSEMRMMLDEEIARAVLVGDQRLASSDDKINEGNIRPIWKDADLYTVKVPVTLPTGATDDVRAKTIIRSIIKARKNYKGSGNPTFFTTEDNLTDMLLLEDNNGREIYESETKLATKLRVKEIVTVPVMENLSREDAGKTYGLVGLIVNLNDYNVGADKGGAINMFDDFDIDYNQQKYLIETRCSGALTAPFSAMAIETVTTTTTGA